MFLKKYLRCLLCSFWISYLLVSGSACQKINPPKTPQVDYPRHDTKVPPQISAPDALADLGWQALSENQLTKAEASFRRALDVNPGNAKGSLGLGELRRQQQECQAARSYALQTERNIDRYPLDQVWNHRWITFQNELLETCPASGQGL
jgi:hypothetical protein